MPAPQTPLSLLPRFAGGAPPAASPRTSALPFGLLRALDRPSDLFRHLGPNKFAV